VKYRNTACVIHTDTFHVSGLDLRFSFGPDRNLIFCDHPDSYLDLEVPFSNARCRWQDGTSDRFYRIRQAGNYWVEVMQGGCKATDTIQIHQTFLELGPDTFFCNGDEISMNLYATDFSPDIEVHWSTGASSPSIRIDAQGLYWVELIDLPCILFDSLNIQSIDCECGPHIPTAFSPNSDGINDFFLPLVASGCSVTRYSFNVYNRFGERVFSSTTFGQGWDGSYKGHPSDIGTYFYDLYYEGGVLWKKYYQKGDVTLIR
jgi:gliding motility-associated-like protein